MKTDCDDRWVKAPNDLLCLDLDHCSFSYLFRYTLTESHWLTMTLSAQSASSKPQTTRPKWTDLECDRSNNCNCSSAADDSLSSAPDGCLLVVPLTKDQVRLLGKATPKTELSRCSTELREMLMESFSRDFLHPITKSGSVFYTI